MGAGLHGLGMAGLRPAAPHRYGAPVGAADPHILMGCRPRDAAWARARAGDGDRRRLCGSGARIARSRRAGAACAARRLGRSIIWRTRSEEHTSELQSLMRISYAVFCLKKKTTNAETD